MKRLLLFVFVLLAQLAHSQYCGTSGPSICTPGGLTAPGITDYATFPCVKQGEAYDQTVQVFFPDTMTQFGFQVAIYSVRIDSFSNLPCGLCWECDNSSFTYAGGSQACFKISGTSNDASGAYQLKIYGTAQTSFGPTSGSLETLGYQFFLNVVPNGATCTPIDISNLKPACAVPLSVDTPCNFEIQLSAQYFGTMCNSDSAVVSLVSPQGNGYTFAWSAIEISNGQIIHYEDSVNTSFTLNAYRSGVIIAVKDNNGCVVGESVWYDGDKGVQHSPHICYTTFDTTLNDNALKIVFQKDNWFNTASGYRLYRVDSAYQDNPRLIGSIMANEDAYIVDPAPNFYDQDNPISDYMNKYSLVSSYTCGGIAEDFSEWYEPTQLYINMGFTDVYPRISWTNSDPITYDAIYIFSRRQGNYWRLRYSSLDINSTSWVDLHPDSTQLEYMVGYRLTVQCDPSRSTDNLSFSNYRSIAVDPQYVDTTEIINPVGISKVEQNRFVFYPNPTESTLYLQLANTTAVSNMQAVVYNTMGQIVVSEAVSAPTINKLDVGALTPGIYMIAIQGNGYSSTMQKFVKK